LAEILKKSFIIIIFLSALFSNNNHLFYRYSNAPMDRGDLKGLIGVMVDFKEDDNPLTSGDGKFLNELDVGFIDDSDIPRCSKQILDPPPHDANYFLSQLKAVKNYYYSISNGTIDLEIDMIDSVYTAVYLDEDVIESVDSYEEQEMEFFAHSENHITYLYRTAAHLAQQEIIEKIDSYGWDDGEDFLIVVFHAGLGQDLGAPLFDPTVYDIHSAYVDLEMLSNFCESDIQSGSAVEDCNGDGSFEIYDTTPEQSYTITNGILMPETLNEIFFDVIEDLHPITYVNDEDLEDIYCNYQLGMTGLLSYFLGYRLGFPVMHSTDNIDPVTRIGKFGLMDYGAYNGRGLIPAPPDVWSRSYKNLTQVQDITSDLFLNQETSFSIPTYTEGGDIYKVSAIEGEYFLMENRSNIIKNNNLLNDSDEYTIDEIVYLLNCNSENGSGCNSSVQSELRTLLFPDNANDTKFYWLDIVTRIFSCEDDSCEFMDDNGVIINFPDYDYGLPGSGLLIWHIQEPDASSISSGMNNDLYNKAVHLEEADGMINIGFPDPSPFGSPLPYGWINDFWFDNNSYYEEVNNSDDMIFNHASTPNSNTYSDLSSNISIEVNPDVNDNINVTVSFDSDRIGIVDDDFTRYLGNDGHGIYYLADSNTIWYSDLYNNRIAMTEDDFCNENCEITGCENFNNFDENDGYILFYEDNLCIVPNYNYMIEGSSVVADTDARAKVYGYFSAETLDPDCSGQCLALQVSSSDLMAVGDINLDGLDEICTLGSCNYANGTTLSGFSYPHSFDVDDISLTLISDLLGDDYPELISFPIGSSESIISIISHEGEILEQFPTYYLNFFPYIISDVENNTTYIVHGNRTIRFDKYNQDASYWHNFRGTTYNYPLVGVSRDIHLENYQNWEDIVETQNFDFNQAFNYPNPFEDNTVFRFYVGETKNLTIKIYSISGFLIDTITLESLPNHQFFEHSYDTSSLSPGLYIAELKSDNTSKIIKLLKSK